MSLKAYYIMVTDICISIKHPTGFEQNKGATEVSIIIVLRFRTKIQCQSIIIIHLIDLNNHA